MIKISKIKKQILSLVIIISLFLPYISIIAAESTSTSYTVNSSYFDSGKDSNSTNFSLTGNVTPGSRGSFLSSSLPLVPGIISSCGKITTAGTYTLGNNIIGIPESCFSVQANGVIIDGAGYSISASIGNTSYAITATSSSVAGSAYGTTTIQNIILSGFAGGVNASGNNAISGNTNGGNAGSVIVSSSTIGHVLISGGLGSGTGIRGNGANAVINNSTTGNITTSGSNGSIFLTSTNLDLSNKNYIASSTLNISYSGNLITTGTTLSSLQNFIVNSVNHGSYIGGNFPLIPGNISTCGDLYFSGIYILTGNITSNCNVLNTGITINGNTYSITGNVTANNHGVTLSDVDVNGIVSTTGAGAGALIINNNSNLTGSISVTGAIQGDGTSSLGNTTINAGGSVATSSVSFVSDVINNGVINSNNAISGKLINNSIVNQSTGYFVFNASSTNAGTVNGNAAFNDSSINTGTVNGNVRFNYFTSIDNAISFGTTTSFSGTGYISGNIYDSTGTILINTWIFNASSTSIGVLKGNAVFNGNSKNATTSTVQGNATFKDSSLNLGTVTGNSDVYSPVVRPLTGTTNGQVIYHDYAGLYFNDVAVGHGVAGKWDDINNWWMNASSTVHSPIIPTEGDNVIILFGNISTTTSLAHVRTATFQATTTNSISITVESTALDAALFNASSTNSGTIIGNATFAGPDTQNLGTVTGYITRQYSTGFYTVFTDFTHNGVHWIVQAINGATVDLTNATYSLIDNFFQALNNGMFIWNNLIGTGAPELTITSPVSGTNIKWKPIISWGGATLCQYKIDGGNYTSVNCANNGSDIPRPSAGSHTIFIKSSNGQNSTEKSLIFTYDNTQPIDTDCTTPLDEATRPYYYLTSNVDSCNITATTTLRGDNNGGGNYYSVGSLTGNGKPIILQNLNATGTVSGFGNMTISSSTLSGNIVLTAPFNSDNISTFGNTVIESGGVVSGGTFTGNLTNNGIITNSTTTPVTVLGNTLNNGIINNGFIFNASSTNSSLGTVNGTTTLNNNSSNQGTVNGDLIYNSYTSNYNIVTISDDFAFLGTATVTGNILDNRGEKINIWHFKDLSSNIGYIKGDAYFNGTSTNVGTISGDAHFSDASINIGVVRGNAYKYNAYLTSHTIGGIVVGSKTYYAYPNGVAFRNISGNNDWSNLSNWFSFVSTSTPLGRTPISGEKIVLFSSTTLKSNLNNNVYFAVSSSTLNGGNYTLNGNVYGNGAYGGYRAYDFNLENITVTGTTTAIGGDGTPDIDGGDGGNIRVLNSSTYVISVNGGDPLHNGGDAGTIYIYNTIATQPNTQILAIGGDSVGCGFGGSGGNVSLVDSSNYILIVDAGRSATTTIAQGGGCVDVPVGNPGSAGQVSVTGTYIAPSNNTNNNANNYSPSYYASGVDKKIVNNINDRVIPVVNFALNLSKFKLTALPVFGDGTKGTFSFGQGIKKFFSTSIPQSVLINFKSTPDLLSYLGIKNLNDFVALRYKSITLKNTKTVGLYTVYSTKSRSPLVSNIGSDNKNVLYQSIKTGVNEKIIITLIPTTKTQTYKAKFNNTDILFTNNQVSITVPSKPGNYILTTLSTPVQLKIQVIGDNNMTSITKEVAGMFTKIINFVKNIFKFR